MPINTPDDRWNIYVLPAALSLALLVTETVYLSYGLPETKDWKRDHPVQEASELNPNRKASTETDAAQRETKRKEDVERRIRKLKVVGRLHGLFLLFFSGVS